MKKIDQILKYIEGQGISVSSFESKCGLSYSYLGKTKERGADISEKFLKKIRENSPEHYYKIFPEENKEDSLSAISTDTSITLKECQEIKIRYEEVQKRVQILERSIEDKDYIITLQKEALLGNSKRLG